MKKLTEVAPRSARAAAPSPPVPDPPPQPGAVMSLDDLPGTDARSQHVEESLERAVLPQSGTAGSAPPATSEPLPPPAPKPAASATKMIATPIDAILRQRVRELRGSYEISEAFVVETALRSFFADRTIDEVAADLRARGGRLRRNR